jgi:hypothetical protein
MSPRTLLALSAGLVFGAASLSADTLVMQDGRRIRGELLSVSRGTMVFDPVDGSRTLRVRVTEVQRVVFNDRFQDDSDDPGDPFGRDDRFGNDRLGTGTGADREVLVNATQSWTDTGINVRAGDTLHFTADGTVVWGPGRQDTPAGEYNSPVNRGRPIPGRPAAGLIGRIGGSAADVFFIGDERGPFRVNNTGRLYLGINDDYLRDNSGSFRVVVSR